ncbi:hypothetical protein G3545_17680 [Starkeya sp. ORNL1]|uniref:hypothetical protein n=1 Tax=Starkeya sp. ORNL1 TaxID=2709380 RepID=UPI001464434E|nr:hypothetical protein [Starkeya sp. ORNL1]QJP15316.1 hypothetical protein G3545_17680 [Starkeya sp. ORNL1]
MTTSEVNRLTALIEAAFAHRKMPPWVLYHLMPWHDGDDDEALAFTGTTWREVTVEHWRERTVAPYFFNGQAFCYYLPSLLTLSLQEPYPYLLAFGSVLFLLQRSDPNLWDDYFLGNIGQLTHAEIAAFQALLVHLSGCGLEVQADLDRAFTTLELLKRRAKS